MDAEGMSCSKASYRKQVFPISKLLLNGSLKVSGLLRQRRDSQCSSMVAKCTMALEVADQLRD
jgi:hypothetical protein